MARRVTKVTLKQEMNFGHTSGSRSEPLCNSYLVNSIYTSFLQNLYIFLYTRCDAQCELHITHPSHIHHNGSHRQLTLARNISSWQSSQARLHLQLCIRLNLKSRLARASARLNTLSHSSTFVRQAISGC